MFRPAMALAVLLVCIPANASSGNLDYHEAELARVSAWLRDVEMIARVNSDPVLRTIVPGTIFRYHTGCALPGNETTSGTGYASGGGIEGHAVLDSLDPLPPAMGVGHAQVVVEDGSEPPRRAELDDAALAGQGRPGGRRP